MIARKLRKIATKFDDEIKFFRQWINEPRTIGSIVPTSTLVAERMASVINLESGLPVLETGPGTGVVTRAMLARGVRPENLYTIEHLHDFALHLRHHYPDINVIEGDAFNLEKTLESIENLVFDAVLSGIPLLNFPLGKRVHYVEALLRRIPPGRPLVQLSYSPRPPAPRDAGNYTIEHFFFTMRNIPPAHLWIYKQEKNH